MTGSSVVRLWESMFDDAAIFPPGNLPLRQAVPAHREHRRSREAWMVGPFVCTIGRLRELAGLAAEFPVSVTVPEGPLAITGVLEHRALDVVSVEVPFKERGWQELTEAAAWTRVYAEVPLAELTPELAQRLAVAGMRLKLRTGGTEAEKFPTAAALAEAIVTAVDAGLPFKLTAGLHNALRHRDPGTGFEHHGFANVVVATVAAAGGADVAELARLLEEHDGDTVAELVRRLTSEEAEAVRRSFVSFGTCSIAEPTGDLVALGLLSPTHLAGATS